jgi:abequosyltransferase
MATFNREPFINETLVSILAQLTDQTELVILDGGSSDGTDQTVQRLISCRPNCHYHRVPVRGGIDLDYCRAISHSVGEYCWLFADDDVIKPGAIARILNEIQDGRDLILVNSEVADRSLFRVLVTRRLNVDADVVIKSGDRSGLLATAGDLLSFIGTVVIRRAVWLSRDANPYIGTEFVHVGIIFQSPMAGECYIIADPLIRIRYGNAQWSRRAFEIWMFNWPALVWSFNDVSPAAKAQVVAREPYRNLVPLILMKARGCFTTRDYIEKLAHRELGIIHRCLASAVARFPDRIFNALLLLLLKILPFWPSVSVDLESSPFYVGRR